MAAQRRTDDNHFRVFAQNLEAAIAKYGEVPRSELLRRQKEQVERLVRLEEQFRQALIRHPWGPAVYRDFITHICDERRNILAARPFFRERQTVFTAEISQAFRDRDATALYRYHCNYQFVQFVLRARDWRGNRIGAKVTALADSIAQVRTELVEMNMPLAISRARIFWSRTPRAQLSYMDLVQITAEGLMSGIDKFVLPFSRSFRAVLIGRMIGNLIEEYSSTLIHFWPADKKKLYRANKVMARLGDSPDFEEVAEVVNQGVEAPGHMTTASEIQGLLAAASTVSSDVPVDVDSADDSGTAPPMLSDVFRADESTHPDVMVENAEALALIAQSIQELPLIEQKLLRLKGVSL